MHDNGNAVNVDETRRGVRSRKWKHADAVKTKNLTLKSQH